MSSAGSLREVAEPARSPSFALAYRDVADAFADLEDALEHHEPIAASEAAWSWWLALQRLREAS